MLGRRFLGRLVSAAASRRSSVVPVQHLGTVGGQHSTTQQELSADQSGNSNRSSSSNSSSSNERPEFPGSRSVQFTTDLRFVDPNAYEPMPVFRVLDTAGNLVAGQFADYIDLELAKRFQKGLTE